MSIFTSNKVREVEALHKEREVLIEELRQVIKGNKKEIAVDHLEDPQLGNLINELIIATQKKNNEYVGRMNESLKVATKNSIIKEMLETVSKQTDSIDEMKESSKELEDSISSISGVVEEVKKYVSDAVDTTVKSVHNMNKSIDVVNQSSEDINKINQMIQEFKTKTAKIFEIVDIVKQVAEQSSLLALNASIEAARAGEAGKGFAVVSTEMKVLSESTTDSAEDIMKYIKELQLSIDGLVSNIANTSAKLIDGNQIVEQSVSDIQVINSEMTSINEQMEEIFRYVKKQEKTMDTFLYSIDGMSDSYNELANRCDDAGKYVFTLIRENDCIRGAIAKESAALSSKEWMDIFETDHIIFTWRLHNAVGKYETLQLESLKNTDGCKLGKWMQTITDTNILSNPSFISMKEHHKELHEIAVRCFHEIERNQLEKAETIYEEAEIAIKKLVSDMREVKRIL